MLRESMIGEFANAKTVEFVDELPKTGSGMILKRDLREMG